MTGHPIKLSKELFDEYLALSADAWANYLPVGRNEETICQKLADTMWAVQRLYQVQAVTGSVPQQAFDEYDRRLEALDSQLAQLQDLRTRAPRKKTKRS